MKRPKDLEAALPTSSPPRRRWLESERLSAYLLVAPSVLALVLVAVYPVVAVVWLSLRRRMLIFGIDEFSGLGNYAFMMKDARFWNALGNTAYFTLLSVGTEFVLGLAIALGLGRVFPGR